MKQGVPAPREIFGLCHIPIIDKEGREPLERRICLRLKAVAAEAVVTMGSWRHLGGGLKECGQVGRSEGCSSQELCVGPLICVWGPRACVRAQASPSSPLPSTLACLTTFPRSLGAEAPAASPCSWKAWVRVATRAALSRATTDWRDFRAGQGP